VRYEDLAGHNPGAVHDYTSEYRGLLALRDGGCGDVELHGYTHMHPDTEAWAASPDRYEAEHWYRELGGAAAAAIETRSDTEHPLSLGMQAIREYFDSSPTTLICPGDEWTNSVLERALDLEVRLVSSYYLALRIHDRFCWSTHVCAPYLDRPDPAWFESTLPVVGSFHDFDIAREGSAWFTRLLDEWASAGARRLMDFRELSAVLGRTLRIEPSGEALHLSVTGDDAPRPVRPLPVWIRYETTSPPALFDVLADGRLCQVSIATTADGPQALDLPVVSSRS
jgi:hypothetical protein